MEFDRCKLTLLNFDDSLKQQKVLQKYPHQWIDCSHIPGTNGFCDRQSLRSIRKKLTEEKTGALTFIGNGNYHYVTYILLQRVHTPFSLILFDHHSDMRDQSPLLSCGSWVTQTMLEHPSLQKVVILGVNQEDALKPKPFSPKPVLMIHEERFNRTPLHVIAKEICSFLKDVDAIYISIDKDVLDRKEVLTNWDQGSMSLVQMLYILEYLAKHFRILAMDVCGEYVKRTEDVLQVSTRYLVKMNEIVNHALVHFARFSGLISFPSTDRPLIQV